MKRIFLILACIFALCAYAQDGYRKMLTDGKVWNNEDIYLNYMTGVEYRCGFSDSVCGDTLIDNLVCKKLRCVYKDSIPINTGFGDPRFDPPPAPYNYVMYEEGTKVYYVKGMDENGEITLLPIFDFSFNIGDDVGGVPVEKIDTINTKGFEYRRLIFNRPLTDGKMCWVEGIGGNTNLYLSPFNFNSFYRGFEMLSCYQDDVCIFERDDFYTKPSTIVGIGKSVSPKNGKIHDVAGRRITVPRKGEVYIKDGKKHVGK